MKAIYFRCEKCDHIMTMEDRAKDFTDGGYRGEPHYSCPMCGCDDLAEVEQCAECGQWYSVDAWYCELHGTERKMCIDCLKRQANFENALKIGRDNPMKINGFFEQFFTTEFIEDLLTTYVKRTQYPETIMQEAYDYCMSDEDYFADLLGRCDNEILSAADR